MSVVLHLNLITRFNSKWLIKYSDEKFVNHFFVLASICWFISLIIDATCEKIASKITHAGQLPIAELNLELDCF